MDEELILQQPDDRRIMGSTTDSPSGPPGAELDTADFDAKKATKAISEKEKVTSTKSNRRRSSSASPLSRRKSISRSPPPRHRGGRDRDRYRGGWGHSPTPPRRKRFRDYSPDRDRRRGRRSPDRDRRSPDRDRRRTRSPPSRRSGRDRDRGFRGGRGRSITRSRSISPIRGDDRESRWSPKKKPLSPPPLSNSLTSSIPGGGPTGGVGGPTSGGPPPQVYNVMAPPLYSNEAYGPAGVPYNHQYSVPPPQTSFGGQQTNTYSAPPPSFSASFQPPNAWGVNDSYGQSTWLQPPLCDGVNQQLQTMVIVPPPVAMQQQLAPTITAACPPQPLQKLKVADANLGTVDSNSGNDAVAQEAENQRDELKRQRNSYLRKTAVLKRELKMLKDQSKDLNSGDEPPSPTTVGFIEENGKLQIQIQKKLNTIENVIDMLSGIIGEADKDELEDDDEDEFLFMQENANVPTDEDHYQHEADFNPEYDPNGDAERQSKKKKKHKSSSSSTDSTSGDESSSSDSSTSSQSSSSNEQNPGINPIPRNPSVVMAVEDDTSSERLKHKAIESMRSKQNNRKHDASRMMEERSADEKPCYNYVFYDPEMHWCQTCNAFPKTAKDYLNHLHTKEHINREESETPWHMEMINDSFPSYANGTTKRTPIRGLTFFVPATAWYCKLCKVWMGDLHCASTHLKSQLHANRYNIFLEQNPHFEVNWLADRQRVLNEQKDSSLPPQITSVSTTAERGHHGNKKSTKKDGDGDGDKPKEKKHKKKSSGDRKEKKASKKKKKQKSKKRKRNVNTSSSSSSVSSTNGESSTSDNEAKKTKAAIPIPDLQNSNPEASIRVSMRRQESSSVVDTNETVPPPPPQISMDAKDAMDGTAEIGKWISAEACMNPLPPTIEIRRDDAILQQWNTVQPVISESEKKLLEQLKGKLKNKEREELTTKASTPTVDVLGKRGVGNTSKHEVDTDSRRRRSRSPYRGGRDGGGGTDRYSRSRGRSRSRSRGGNRGSWGNRRDRRMRSRSRGRRSRSRSYGRRRRSRSIRRRRSRTPNRRRRGPSRSNSRSWSRSPQQRSRSNSRNRLVEKAVVKHSEFRPRVPERESEKPKKSNGSSKDKKKTSSPGSKSSSTTSGLSMISKKLPFIGKMPVFKKQASNAGIDEKRTDESTADTITVASSSPACPVMPIRVAPTAAQIQMAMMEDAYGNAPPFHPEGGIMQVDYDDLMPDPMQYVNLMGQAPPPPPPPPTDVLTKDDSSVETTESGGGNADREDSLPPGIDEAEKDFLRKAVQAGALPKDLEEALDILFPGDKKDDMNEEERARRIKAAASGQTQIIVEQPVMHTEDLVKQGIHMVTIEETATAAVLAMDEASQLSMNEPLVFNKPSGSIAHFIDDNHSLSNDVHNMATNGLSMIQQPAEMDMDGSNESVEEPVSAIVPDQIQLPQNQAVVQPKAVLYDPEDIAVYDLDDIPQPPSDTIAASDEESKQRRQEELDDLAMLGIDEDDMAAQCL